VVNTSWNIYNFRMGLINRLLQSNHEVIAIAPKDSYTKDVISSGCEFVNLTMDSKGVNPVKDVALTMELFKIYRRIKPDIILHFTIKPNIYGTLAAGLLNIPVINNVCGLGTVFHWNSFISRVAFLMYRIAFRSANLVFFQNREDEKYFTKKVDIPDLRTAILPGSGINISAFKPKNYVKNKEFTFIMVARLLVDKGVEEFVEAARILKKKGVKARYLVYGRIDKNHKRAVPVNKLKKWIKEGVIEYKGVSDNIAEPIGQSDCVVLPSYREGTPRTLLEGGSMAKPLIATNVPGCNDVTINGYNGLLCKVKDSNDLALKMEEILSMPVTRIRAMGQNSRRHIAMKYEERFVVDKYLQAINNIAGTFDVSWKSIIDSMQLSLN